MNRHPRSAMEFLAGAGRENLVKFYDQIVADV
jgi:hypothetical protein